ncbi:RAD51-associated protein 2 isoform X2 [Pseudophryne corroboree]|uniref:RAD51-associated protein 2 isoform X2 n=1 Tax=Pseudophryne corroboree TaxID=495146 RepID=UPI003081941A
MVLCRYKALRTCNIWQASDMYREHYQTAVGHIGHDQMKCVGTLQNQHLQLGTDRHTPVAETIKEETHRLINIYSPHFLVFSECGTNSNARVQIRNQYSYNDAGCFQPRPKHKQLPLIFNVVEIFMEKIIFSQCDLIWENYIAAAYDMVYSTDMLPYSDVSTKKISRFVQTKFSRYLTAQTREGTHSLYKCNKETALGCREEITCDSNEETDHKLENPKPCKRKRTGNLFEAGEKRLKKTLTMNKFSDYTKPVLEFSNRTNLGISNKGFSCFRNPDGKKGAFPQTATSETIDHCSFVRLFPEIEAYTEKNTFIYPLSNFNAQQKCNSSGAGCKLRNVGSFMGSVLKDLALSHFPFGDIHEDVRGTYIPQTDSAVDYTLPCGSRQKKAHYEIQLHHDESLYMINSADNNINLHVILSLHPCHTVTATSNVVSSVDNCTEPGEPQGRKCLNYVAGEKCMTQNQCDISANILTSSPKWNGLQTTSLSLPYIDKRTCHFGNKEESFLSKEETFSVQRNYPRKLEKQHFLPNINFSTLAASLLGTPINDSLFFHGSGLQSTSKIESSHEMINKSLLFSFRHEGIKLEQTEVEVSLSTENINKRTGSAHLDYTTAFKNVGFCFPSHFQNTVDTQHSAEDSSAKTIDTNWTSLSSKQLSFTETFKKICLDQCLLQLDSINLKETSCSFRHDHLFCESRTTIENNAAINSQSIESQYKSCITKCQYANQSYVSDTDHHGCKEEFTKNIHNEIGYGSFLNTKICGTFICETSIQNVTEQMSCVERHEHVKLQLLNETLNFSRVSSFTNTMWSENTLNPKIDSKDTKEIEVKGASPYVLDIQMTSSTRGTRLSLENAACDMKSQFDLVIEELKLFHQIGEENGDSTMTTEGNGLEHTCSTLEELPEMSHESIPSNFVKNDGNSQDIINESKYVCDSVVVAQVKEQEVPLQCWTSACPGDEESLYSSDKEGDVAKLLSWTPAFWSSNNRETLHTERGRRYARSDILSWDKKSDTTQDTDWSS